MQSEGKDTPVLSPVIYSPSYLAIARLEERYNYYLGGATMPHLGTTTFSVGWLWSPSGSKHPAPRGTLQATATQMR